jgi:hypothetical protein
MGVLDEDVITAGVLDQEVLHVVHAALDQHPAVVTVDVLLELLPRHYRLSHFPIISMYWDLSENLIRRVQ